MSSGQAMGGTRTVTSNESATTSYEAPSVTVIGNVHEVTLNGKVFAPTNDYSYPTIVTSTFGHLNFS
jgi:hypothetical protein